VWKERIMCWQISQSKGRLLYEVDMISFVLVDAGSAGRGLSSELACFSMVNREHNDSR
jgi:hypothetical protein